MSYVEIMMQWHYENYSGLNVAFEPIDSTAITHSISHKMRIRITPNEFSNEKAFSCRILSIANRFLQLLKRYDGDKIGYHISTECAASIFDIANATQSQCLRLPLVNLPANVVSREVVCNSKTKKRKTVLEVDITVLLALPQLHPNRPIPRLPD